MKKRILKKAVIEETDLGLLSLFPSLNFNKPNVIPQKKKGIQTLITILYMTTEGAITKYELTKPKADIRFGGEVADKALKRLKKLRLLRVEKISSEKKTFRNDFFLSSKGLLFCICFKEFQSKANLERLITQTKIKSDKLVFVIKLFNDTLIRSKEAGEELSPLVSLLGNMVKKGSNFETMSEEEIVNNIRQTQEETISDLLNTDMCISPLLLPLELSKQDAKTQRIFKKNLSETTRLFSDPSLTSIDKELVAKKTANMTRNIFTFFTSPEVLYWIKGGLKNFSLEDLYKITVKKLEINDPDSAIEKMEDLFCTMREILFEQLFADFCNS